MHVASVMLFEGDPPPYDELLEAIERRLHLVPRYRQRLAYVPLGQGRPKWVDDPHLNLRYHVRSTALPSPGSEEQLKDLAGPRVLAAARPRQAALGDLAGGGRSRAAASPCSRKTHHALVDGISGMDIVSVLFDAAPEPAAPADPGERWLPRPLPSRAQLLGEALLERATAARRGGPQRARRLPRAAPSRWRARATPPWAWAPWRGRASTPRPPRPYNGPIGPHRRFTWVRAELGDMKAIKDSLGRHRQRRGAGHRGRCARAPPAPARAADRRPGAEGDGAGERARRRGARRARQPRGGDDGAAAGVVPGAGGPPRPRARGAEGPEAGGQAVGAQVLTELSRLRAAHDHGPGARG